MLQILRSDAARAAKDNPQGIVFSVYIGNPAKGIQKFVSWGEGHKFAPRRHKDFFLLERFEKIDKNSGRLRWEVSGAPSLGYVGFRYEPEKVYVFMQEVYDTYDAVIDLVPVVLFETEKELTDWVKQQNLISVSYFFNSRYR